MAAVRIMIPISHRVWRELVSAADTSWWMSSLRTPDAHHGILQRTGPTTGKQGTFAEAESLFQYDSKWIARSWFR